MSLEMTGGRERDFPSWIVKGECVCGGILSRIKNEKEYSKSDITKIWKYNKLKYKNSAILLKI